MLNRNTRATRTEVYEVARWVGEMVREARKIKPKIRSFHLQRVQMKDSEAASASYGFGDGNSKMVDMGDHEDRIDAIMSKESLLISDFSWIWMWLFLRDEPGFPSARIDYAAISELTQYANPNGIRLRSINDHSDKMSLKVVELIINNTDVLMLGAHPNEKGDMIYTVKVLVNN